MNETRSVPKSAARRDRILLTGASGYIGGRLLHRFEAKGRSVRCLARRPEFLVRRVADSTEVVEGDVLDGASLVRAFEGVETAFYLVHSMGNSSAEGFEAQDRAAARNFGTAAAEAGVRRIVYLGGLGDENDDLSPHLRSRHEVGRALRDSGVPTIEFRASVVIGSGSLSFEMLRSLVEKLPVMVTPRWVHVGAQPIAIDDVLAYLEAAVDLDVHDSRIYEIGGAEILSYGALMKEYARARGLRRVMLPVPVLTPRLSSLWLGLVTPLYARVGRDLIESICHETIIKNDRARRDFAIEPIGIRDAIELALRNEDRAFAETRWSDAISSGGTDPDLFRSSYGVRRGRRLADSRECTIDATPSQAFAPIRRIGGATGWYAFNGLWRVRGAIDMSLGGVGLRRGRADPEHVREGDTVDWWRVEKIEADQLLRMRAEMKLPGRAWLEFEVKADGDAVTIRQTAVFDPAGLAGLVYWYAVYPLHALVFRGMLEGIARAVAVQKSGGSDRELLRDDPVCVQVHREPDV